MFLPLFLIIGQFTGIHANITKLVLGTELKFGTSYVGKTEATQWTD